LRVRDDKLLERDLIEVHLKTIVHFLDFTEAVGAKELIDEVVQAIQAKATTNYLRSFLQRIADRLNEHLRLKGNGDTALVRNAMAAVADARKVLEQVAAKP
jgi:hypothetical protein